MQDVFLASKRNCIVKRKSCHLGTLVGDKSQILGENSQPPSLILLIRSATLQVQHVAASDLCSLGCCIPVALPPPDPVSVRSVVSVALPPQAASAVQFNSLCSKLIITNKLICRQYIRNY
jgi:hypothetical protein